MMHEAHAIVNIYALQRQGAQAPTRLQQHATFAVPQIYSLSAVPRVA